MQKIQFQCDYNEGAHPLIMQRLMETNMEQTVGYGEDPHCQRARELIREACQAPKADVHFLVGGTQANTTVISHLLRPYQGVIAADTGHINVHETGAIEATGHKVLALPNVDGKISAAQIDAAMKRHYAEDGPEHMVQPGMVYLSFPTEVGPSIRCPNCKLSARFATAIHCHCLWTVPVWDMAYVPPCAM